MQKSKYKFFVIDTNVILHDSSCIYQFQKHNVVIPITVLEEIDQFKKGNEPINLHAREFVRALDSLSKDKLLVEGMKIAPHKGHIIIKLDRKFDEEFSFNFPPSNPDHHILNVAHCLSKDFPDSETILISKDVNLRMKAKAIGLRAEDYTKDHVKDISQLYKGYRIEENVSEKVIKKMYESPYEIPASELKLKKELLPNEYLIMRSGRQSALGIYEITTKTIKRVSKVTTYGITPRNAEQTFAINALLNPSIKLVSISGKAGTGKTLLALAAALANKKYYRQIYIARPVVPLSNKDIGYLPGDIQSKLEPYMQPLYDNLGVIRFKQFGTESKRDQIKKFLESQELIIAPLSYIRGRSLVGIFFIVDEAQNLTPHEIRTIITRAGENTKMVFTGDIFQIDHPYLNSQSNGLSYLIAKMKGQNLYTHINLEKGERSDLAELASNLLCPQKVAPRG